MWPAVPTTIDRISPPAAFPLLPFATPRPLLAARLFVLRGRAAAARAALALADPFEDLDQPEVDLPLLHVDADHLDLDLVAQAVDAVRVLAAQEVRVLDELVVVVGHRR